MGMYDTVHFHCPSCGADMHTQSKAGECMLRDYQADEVPVDIARDLVREVLYCDCGTGCQIVEIPPDVETTRLALVKK